MLLAIAKIESGRPLPPRGALGPWPWTTNAGGAGSFYDTGPNAIAGGRDILRHSRNLDVGCMQVSLLHHPAAFATLENAFEPALNADYAARFLLALQSGTAGGNWQVAAGFYHIANACARDHLPRAGRSDTGRAAAGPATAIPLSDPARRVAAGAGRRRRPCPAARRGADRRLGACEALPGGAMRCRMK